ncbi:yfjR [Scenedesmus sp. PABB004]|nr:yfjR [Scenedesmus sp. PABB004]
MADTAAATAAAAAETAAASALPAGDIGFVGLGAMGRGMAANAAAALARHPGTGRLLLHNRTPGKAAPLLALGEHVREAAGLAELATGCGAICLMLADDGACDSVLGALCGAGLRAGALIINHSTCTAAFAEAARATVAAAGGAYVAAPVWGRPDAAAAARLVVAPGGPAAAVARAAPLLAAHGRLLAPLATARAASALKLIGNGALFGFVHVVAEALTLADKAGLPRDAVLGLVDAFFPAPAVQGYARRMAAGEFDATAGFTVDLALKDVRYVRALAEAARAPLATPGAAAGCPRRRRPRAPRAARRRPARRPARPPTRPPVPDAVFHSLLCASANGHGQKDVGAMILACQLAAGLPPPPDAAPDASA